MASTKFALGDKVTVLHGPRRGVTGVVERVERTRAGIRYRVHFRGYTLSGHKRTEGFRAADL